MSAYPTHEVYEMDGMAVHRLSPSIYQQNQQQPLPRTIIQTSNHVPVMQSGVQWQAGMQVSPSSFDSRILTAGPAPMRTYQPSPQSQATYSSTVAYHEQQPQPVIVIDPYSSPLFQDRVIKIDYIRKVLGVLFTQIGVCFLIVNVFNLRSVSCP